MVDRKNDPAFLYFPDNYRWSMGLMICLSGAPWGGAEIDEVHRVGRALAGKVGDDDAWFAEWTRMGDMVEARGRAAEKDGHKQTAAACFLRATRYYQTGERFLQPKSQRGMDVYAKSVKTFRDAAAIIRSPRIEHVEVPYEGKSLPALLVHPDPAATIWPSSISLATTAGRWVCSSVSPARRGAAQRSMRSTGSGWR